MWNWVEFIGYVGTTLTIAAWSMRSCLHLRVAGAGSSLAFLSYGLLSASYPIVVTELILLPLNLWRLAQLWRAEHPATVVGPDRNARQDWFLRHAVIHQISGPGRLVTRGDPQSQVVLVVSGDVVASGGRRLPPGSLIGASAVFADAPAPDSIRMLGDTQLASLSLDAARRLIAQCPDFAWNLSRAALGHGAAILPHPVPEAPVKPHLRAA